MLNALFHRSLTFCALACLVASRLAAEIPISKENQIKAVFLFNFAQFVEWPAAAFPTPTAPLVVGILGEDPFGDYLEATVKGEKAGGHPLVIERYRYVEEIQTCHVLFISSSETGRLPKIFGQLAGRSILTAGDAEGFARGGGMIRFVAENKRVRLRINLGAVRANGLAVSSKLLRAAEIINGGGHQR